MAPSITPTQTCTVTPSDAAQLEAVAGNPDSDTSDDRQFTVSGLTDGTEAVATVWS